jgi:CubicO group peptidase (beta-lactamase class C family)
MTPAAFVRQVLLAAGALALVPAAAGAAAAQGLDHEEIDAIVKRALEAWKVPGVAVAVVYRGRVYCKGFGVKRLGGRDRVTTRTLFPLASCTKCFTTTALAMLADESKLGWDDPVRKHVPFFRLADPLADANVTLRDIASHRTGVASHDLLWYRSGLSQEELIRRIGRIKLSKPFRSAYQYQSIMVMAAGWAVGTASGKPWDAFVKERIFGPLGMTRTCCTTTEALRDEDHAAGHRKDRKHPDRVEIVDWYPQPRPDPAGSINSCALDLSKWLLFQLQDGRWRDRRLVSAENLHVPRTPQTIMILDGSARAMQPQTVQMSYGMGWVIQDYHGRLLNSHGGAIDGFRAHFTLAPQAQLGIALLNNLEGSQMNLAISNSIVDLVLGLPTRDWNAHLGGIVKKDEAAARAAVERWKKSRRPGTKPSREPAAYAGCYEHPAYGTARIECKDDRLRWRWSAFHGTLEHFHYDTFLARHDFLGDPPVVFALDATGDVAGMKFLGMDFKRRKP